MRDSPAARLAFTILRIIQLALIGDGAISVKGTLCDLIPKDITAGAVLLLDVDHIYSKASTSFYRIDVLNMPVEAIDQAFRAGDRGLILLPHLTRSSYELT